MKPFKEANRASILFDEIQYAKTSALWKTNLNPNIHKREIRRYKIKLRRHHRSKNTIRPQSKDKT